MALMDPVVNEFRGEVATTRRVLERIPEKKLAWKPHPKSMALGELAWHMATVPVLMIYGPTPDENRFG